MRAAVFALILSLAAGSAVAQAPVAKPRLDTPTPVSPVTIMPPTSKPTVVTTWPAAGQAIAPGVLVLKVVFDQQMTPRDFAYGAAPGSDKLECLKTPRLLNDDKTFVLLCTTLPGKSYAITLNDDPAGVAPAGFANLAENRAVPSVLAFTTTTGEPVTKLREAIKAAGLGDIDVPVDEAPRMTTSSTGATNASR